MTTLAFPQLDKTDGPRETGGARAETRVYIPARPGASRFLPSATDPKVARAADQVQEGRAEGGQSE